MYKYKEGNIIHLATAQGFIQIFVHKINAETGEVLLEIVAPKSIVVFQTGF